MIRASLTALMLIGSLAAAGAQDIRPFWSTKDAIQARNYSPKVKIAAVCGPAGCCSDQRCASRYGCENNSTGQSTCTAR
ncbi:hypothetical protein ACVIGB_000503 [Bradyrhizobium sp. USDA 4341]